MPHPVDLVVDRGLLLDIGVRLRHVGLRLVVVVVRHEVLHRVVREEAPELLVELRRQRLVVHHHERRPVHPREHLRHRERLARPGHAEQHLVTVAALEPLHELADRARLIARQLEVGVEVEAIVDGGHGNPQSYYTRPGKGVGIREKRVGRREKGVGPGSRN